MNLNEIQDRDVKAVIEKGIALRYEAYNLEQEAKALKAKANELLEDHIMGLDGMKATCDGVGSATFIITARTKFDKGKFKLSLAQAGVSALLIANAEETATTVSSSDSIRFTPWGEE